MNQHTRNIEETPYFYEAVQDDIILAIAERVKSLRMAGKMTPEVLRTIRDYFRIKNIYHSNAIEGNLLDVGETRQVVEFGLTITGKPLKDQAEAKNLAGALDLLEELATKSQEPIREHEIRQIHSLVLKGIDDDNAGKYRAVPVEISGSKFKPPGPESLRPQMTQLSEWLAGASTATDNFATPQGLIRAAVAHTWFVCIHPFIDGNGRVARLLMNLMLMRFGYPIAVITREDRERYYDALETSQSGDLSPFLALLTESVHESLEEYERAAAEQRELEEWAHSLGDQFGAAERVRANNKYEVWKSAMDLLRSYFQQTATLVSQSTHIGQVSVRDFGMLEFEKYLSLRSSQSAKKTWFFRVDFVIGNRAARYLFFFGFASPPLRANCDVTLYVAREEPQGSYHYEKLDNLATSDVPSLLEIGYQPNEEQFLARYLDGSTRLGKIHEVGRRFFDEVVATDFS
jgi:Fic family protein